MQHLLPLLCGSTGGLFPTESHEYEVFRFALSHHQDIPKLMPQVDMVKLGNSFSMTYACKYYLPPRRTQNFDGGLRNLRGSDPPGAQATYS